MQYGLEDYVIEGLCSVFRRYDNVNRVLIFGSRAKGNYRAGSDIDLAVVADNLTFEQRMKMMCDIDDLLLLYKVDMVDYKKKVGSPIYDHIKRVGKTLYEQLDKNG